MQLKNVLLSMVYLDKWYAHPLAPQCLTWENDCTLLLAADPMSSSIGFEPIT